MKKTLIAMGVLLFSVNCFADDSSTNAISKTSQTPATTQAQIEEGKQYIVLPTYPSPEKEVIEFFSFNCPSCFRFETKYHGTNLIAKALPEEMKVKRYHLLDFGSLAMELSEAWAIANVLGIEDKASEALYNAVQKDRTIKTADDIKTVFAKLGVDEETYEKTKNSFLVKAFMAQQADAIKEMQPSSIPSIIINRKFYINSSGLDTSNDDAYIADYVRVATFLANLDPNVKTNAKKKK
ncbi:DsbA family protein [Gilliamella apicola]|uniref:DsbA family protein n=1 Tax=Gilliamella apicola TaxID=1196095 RepID=UPI002FEDF9C0